MHIRSKTSSIMVCLNMNGSSFANLREFIFQILSIAGRTGMFKGYMHKQKRAFPYDCSTKTAVVFCRKDFEHLELFAHNF